MDKNLVKWQKIVLKTKIEAQKAWSYKFDLQTIKNFSIFSLKLFLFIRILLEKIRKYKYSFISLVLSIINLKIIL